MDLSILLMMSLTALLSFMCFIDEHSLVGAPYFRTMTMSSAWLEVSKVLTKSENVTHVGRLWLCLRFRSVFIHTNTSDIFSFHQVVIFHALNRIQLCDKN